MLHAPGGTEKLDILEMVQTLLGWSRECAPRQGTLIVRDIDRLSAEDQQAMLTWLVETRRSVQTISVCAEPLFPLVARGQVLADLYYDLNIVYVQLDAAGS